MDNQGVRGSTLARIDDKGRLKVPTAFRGVVRAESGPDVFVTSQKGECVLIYPMEVWRAIEQKLLAAPSSLPTIQKYQRWVQYYGLETEIDAQGRVLIPAHLRQHAGIVGDVRVFGKTNHLEVWNEERFFQQMTRDAWTDEDGRVLAEHGL